MFPLAPRWSPVARDEQSPDRPLEPLEHLLPGMEGGRERGREGEVIDIHGC